MPYARSGEVALATEDHADYAVTRCRWLTASTGVAVPAEKIELDGTLHRVIVRHSHTAYTGTMGVALYDEMDADVFGGLVTPISANTTTTKSIYEPISSDRLRATPVLGCHALRVTLASATTSYGEVEIYTLRRRPAPLQTDLLE